MNVSFQNIDLNERPMLILKNASDQNIGVLSCLTSLDVDLKYNETSTITFEVPAFFDGQPTPFYDLLVSRRVVEIPGVGQFILVNPSEVDDGITRKKTCKAYSLDYEFTFKKITIPDGVYKFWDSTAWKNTVLGMILELMPSWSLGHVPISISNKYRMFSLDNENLYNLIKGTLQETYECLFEFDTINRVITIKDANEEVGVDPVYFSTKNLIKSIEVSENTEDIVTRLDVNGAEGVDIRSANPTGTNKIINLDYYMTPDNFPQNVIDAYNQWKETVSDYKDEYYDLSIAYSIQKTRLALEQAVLTDIKNDFTALETRQSVWAEQYSKSKNKSEALAQLSAIKNEMNSLNSEMSVQEQTVAEVEAICNSSYRRLSEIVKMCDFYTSYDENTKRTTQRYTDNERMLIDRYIIDGEIEDSTFVFEATERINPIEKIIYGKSITLRYSTWDDLSLGGVSDLYFGDTGYIGRVKQTYQIRQHDENTEPVTTTVFILYDGVIDGKSYADGTLTIMYSGSSPIYDTEIVDNVWEDINGVTHYTSNTYYTITYPRANCHFTQSSTEFQRQSVALELYEYGKNILYDLSRPSHTFSIDSANFLSLAEFEQFKNQLSLGKSVYVELADDSILKPICIGVNFDWFDKSSLNLEFSDSFASPDKSFRLVDLLEKSISMGRTVDSSKYAYSAYVDSGVDSYVNNLLNSAIDVAKTAITSSSNQAVTWDESGLRLRRRLANTDDEYEPEQIWINNNSIIMTTDGWQTSEMAIGKFYDANIDGYVWGIAAPRIVGTMIAGSSLIIESAKESGGHAVFRMDENGCVLYNTDMTISNDSRKIIINPDVGIAIGNNNMVFNPDPGADEDDYGGKDFKSNANFWVDSDGNITMRGNITATGLTIVDPDYSADTITGDNSNSQLATMNSLINLINSYSADNSAALDKLIENVNAQLAQQSASTSHIFYGSEDKSNVKPGDVWYGAGENGDRVYKYVGYWENIYSTAVEDWLSVIGSADALRDGEIVVYNTSSDPSLDSSIRVNTGDIWIKPVNASYGTYSWDNNQWVAASDNSMSSFINTMYDAIGESAKVYIGSSENASAVAGDIWFNQNSNSISIKKKAYEYVTYTHNGITYDYTVPNNAAGKLYNPILLLEFLLALGDKCNSQKSSTIKFSATENTPSGRSVICAYYMPDLDDLHSRTPNASNSIDLIRKHLQMTTKGANSWYSVYSSYYRKLYHEIDTFFEDENNMNISVLDNFYDLFEEYYRKDTTSNARIPDGNELHYIIYYVSSLNDISSVPEDYMFFDRATKHVYVKRGGWKDYSSAEGTHILNSAANLRPQGSTSLTIYKDDTLSDTYVNGDIYINKQPEVLGIWNTNAFIAQQGRAAYNDDLSDVFTQSANRVVYSSTTPTVGENSGELDVNDIWFNTNSHSVKRVATLVEWEDITSSVQAASSSVTDGTNGINFTYGTNNTAVVTINKASGIKAGVSTVLGGAYFQVSGVNMGFFDSNNRPLFEYSGGRMQFANTWNAINSGAAGDSGIVSPLESPTAICKSHVDCLAGCGYYVEGNHVYVTVNVKSANAISAQQVVNTGNIPSAYRPSTNVYSVGLCGSGSASGLIVGGVNSYGNVYILQSAIAFDWCDLVIDYVI